MANPLFRAMSSVFGSFGDFVQKAGRDYVMYKRYGPMWRDEVQKVQIAREAALQNQQRAARAEQRAAGRHTAFIRDQARQELEFARENAPEAVAARQERQSLQDERLRLGVESARRRAAEETSVPTEQEKTLEALEQEEGILEARVGIGKARAALRKGFAEEPEKPDRPKPTATERNLNLLNAARRIAGDTQGVRFRTLADVPPNILEEAQFQRRLGEVSPAQRRAIRASVGRVERAARRTTAAPAERPAPTAKKPPSVQKLRSSREPAQLPEGSVAIGAGAKLDVDFKKIAEDRIRLLRQQGLTDEEIRNDPIVSRAAQRAGLR